MGRRLLWDQHESASVLVAEAEAFLNGGLSSIPGHGGVRKPACAGLNWVAHGSPGELREVVAGGAEVGIPDGPWAPVVEVICRDLVQMSGDDPHRLRRFQRECLVPLELELLEPEADEVTPRELLLLARTRLRSHPSAGTPVRWS